MGFFDRFRSPPEPDPGDPAGVFAAFRRAVERRDARRFATLCETHQALIREHFTSWNRVPEPLRSDRRQVELYMQTLVSIAEAFDRAGIPELLQSLMGDEASNPLRVWENELAKAQSLVESGRNDEAIAVLEGCLVRTKNHVGSGVDTYAPRTHGLLGIAYFHSGWRREAVEHTETALELCRTQGDRDGIQTYTDNLRQIREAFPE